MFFFFKLRAPQVLSQGVFYSSTSVTNQAHSSDLKAAGFQVQDDPHSAHQLVLTGLCVSGPAAPAAPSESAPVIPGNSQPRPPSHQQQDVPVPGPS